MHYCLSDIHGEFDRYQAILEEIHLSDEDTLYVIGDVIDRAPGGVDILEDIMARKNVVMLMGNHEQMCLDTLGKINVYGARQLWASNGGSVTRRELLYHMDARRRNALLNFLASLPDKLDIEVNGRRFHLVHGCPSTSHDSRIWERPSLDMPNPFPDGRTIIVGHTPVCFLLYPGRTERERWLKELESTGQHMTILHAPAFIDIDCGCGNATEARRLACLRLEDLSEFYT